MSVLRHLLLCGLVGFALSAPTANEGSDKPDCSYAYLDRCGRDLFLWRSDADDVGAPVTAKELKEHCERQAAAEKCVRSRAENCTVGLARGASRVFIDAIRDEFETRCDPTTPDHAAYLEMAPCLNTISDDLRTCTIRFIQTTDRAATDSKGKSFRQKVPRACCNFALYADCMFTAARKCSERHEVFMRYMVNGAAGDLVDVACGSYEPNSDVCKKYQRQGKGNATSIDDSDYKGIRTLISALGKLAESISSN